MSSSWKENISCITYQVKYLSNFGFFLLIESKVNRDLMEYKSLIKLRIGISIWNSYINNWNLVHFHLWSHYATINLPTEVIFKSLHNFLNCFFYSLHSIQKEFLENFLILYFIVNKFKLLMKSSRLIHSAYKMTKGLESLSL